MVPLHATTGRTFALSEKIHERFFVGYQDVKLPHKCKIAVGGCIHNCVKPDLNDIGIIGTRTKDEAGKACPGYKICIGGRWGKKTAKGQPLSKIFTSEEEVLDTIEKIILFYKDNGLEKERFADTIARIGFEEVEKEAGKIEAANKIPPQWGIHKDKPRLSEASRRSLCIPHCGGIFFYLSTSFSTSSNPILAMVSANRSFSSPLSL